MGTDGVVFLEPSLGLVLHVVQIGEDPGVDDAIAIAAVEPLGEGILGRFAGTRSRTRTSLFAQIA
jgi:hypothetical protein